MFYFLHGYLPGVWEAQVNTGLVGENDGIRFCQNIMLDENLKFNKLAAKGGKLYNIVAERKCPFYIDRLQGGTYIDDYKYDKTLIYEYKKLLGDNFWGFQMHEWVSNYRYEVFEKLKDLPVEYWTEEKIKKHIFKKFPYPYLFLESVTAKEMAACGKPANATELYENITSIYKKRLKIGDLLPCDSNCLAYAFEISCGAKRLMPEVGAQTYDARIQICYARGMTRTQGKSFGVYYEPWGGSPFSACCYHKENKNEWGIGESTDFPFETNGENGGSSRSLQKRIFLYSFLSGAEFISEEWGVCNTFYDWKNFELSPYGQAKKEFLEFTRKYTDVGEKLAPIAVILPKNLMVLDNIYEDNMYLGFSCDSPLISKVKNGVREIFASSYNMLGNEVSTLKNSEIPDAIDLLNEDDALIEKYDFIVDLTCDDDFAKKHENICQTKDIKQKLEKLLPCYVTGNAHWLVNACTSGGYYLTVFNHSGIQRTVAEGEIKLSEAETTVKLHFKDEKIPKICAGNEILTKIDGDGDYELNLPAGEWAFIKF